MLRLCVPMVMAAAAQSAIAIQMMLIMFSVQGRHWVLDPIDGTRGFVGLRQYAICLGLLDQGQVPHTSHHLCKLIRMVRNMRTQLYMRHNDTRPQNKTVHGPHCKR